MRCWLMSLSRSSDPQSKPNLLKRGATRFLLVGRRVTCAISSRPAVSIAFERSRNTTIAQSDRFASARLSFVLSGVVVLADAPRHGR